MLRAIWNDVERRKQLLFSVLAIIIIQALFWWAYLPLVSPTNKPFDRIPLYGAAHAQPVSPDWSEVQKAKFAPVELPWESCCKPGYHAMRVNSILPVFPMMDWRWCRWSARTITRSGSMAR